MLKELNSLYYINCQFVSFYSEILSLVDSMPEVGIVGRNLSELSIENIIWSIKDWLPVNILDLSGNYIGDNPEKFFNS